MELDPLLPVSRIKVDTRIRIPVIITSRSRSGQGFIFHRTVKTQDISMISLIYFIYLFEDIFNYLTLTRLDPNWFYKDLDPYQIQFGPIPCLKKKVI